MKRCSWVKENNQEYIDYHDLEWGEPIHDDRLHFEMLILEGAQAGLSWETILKKRNGYQKAFDNFDVEKVSNYDEKKVQSLLEDSHIVRNRLKINSAIFNARVFISIQNEFGSFDQYIWLFVNNTPIINRHPSLSFVPTKTALSDLISNDLKRRGMKFVGSTIIYSYLQAVGIVNDHTQDCYKCLPQ